MTLAGIAGVIVTIGLKRKYIIWSVVSAALAAPLLWLVLASYQKQRIMSLLSPNHDPMGSGYNSIQSVIAVGSGRFSGRGLGNGIQTQLSFLPEKHTDFMFAAISEELGFIGALLVLATFGFLLYRLISSLSGDQSVVKKAYITGVFATLFLQIFVHVGMNMGMLPITGLPLPLVSYGGSSLLSTMIMLGLALQVGRDSATIQAI
jgi:rod shape determining protein RodA